MKKIYLFFVAVLFASNSFSQSVVCNSTGNLMIFTCYDGGNLNINIDVNIPNLKIGVVSYEGVAITISGTFANNVTAVACAGYNGSNAHCGSVITNSISGTSGTSVNTIQFLPASTLVNPYGSSSIICGYSCSTTTSQGGCNTVDQIEAFFLNKFSGSVVYAHKVQYGCWAGTQTVSGGGTCCGLTTDITSLSADQQFKIYPNPATNNLFIESSEKIKNITCFNTLGQSFDLTDVSGTVDVSALTEGMYFLNIITASDKRITKKFVKE